jgi:hypothetical protein
MELKDRVFEVSHSLSRKEAELENAERRCALLLAQQLQQDVAA